MKLNMLKSKLHRAVVTEADLNYLGSITIASDLMQAAGIVTHEQVCVVNNNNGARIETYVIPGKVGSGTVCLNGAAARWFIPGDIVIIMSYCQLDQEDLEGYHPTIVLLDGKENKVLSIQTEEAAG